MEHASEHTPVGYGLYTKVWLALLALTAVTVGLSYLNLQNITLIAALIIATGKALLVLLYFMHLRYESRLFTHMVITTLLFFAVCLLLSFADYSFR